MAHRTTFSLGRATNALIALPMWVRGEHPAIMRIQQGASPIKAYGSNASRPATPQLALA